MPLRDLSALTELPAVTLREIQQRVGGKITGDPSTMLSGANSLEGAKPGDLAFAEHEKYLPLIAKSQASVVVVPTDFPAVAGKVLLRTDQPRLAFIKAMRMFHPALLPRPGIHASAIISPDIVLGPGAAVRERAVVRAGVHLGAGTLVEAGAFIGERVTIGDHAYIGPNVVIMRDCLIGHRVIIHPGSVIGADGFGIVWDGAQYLKIPQVGNVIIEDDVELGANVCVDRATFGSTIVKRGAKIDNLVQIAHNDVIGAHVAISGQAGFAGSVRVGDHAVIGGQAGFADHVDIGEGARVGGASAVIGDVPAGQTVWGYPARPIQKVKREMAALAYLPELIKRTKGLKRKSRRSSAD